VITIPRTIATFGFLSVSTSTLWLVKYAGSWWAVAIIYSLVFLVCMLIIFFGVKEKHTVPPRGCHPNEISLSSAHQRWYEGWSGDTGGLTSTKPR